MIQYHTFHSIRLLLRIQLAGTVCSGLAVAGAGWGWLRLAGACWGWLCRAGAGWGQLGGPTSQPASHQPARRPASSQFSYLFDLETLVFLVFPCVLKHKPNFRLWFFWFFWFLMYFWYYLYLLYLWYVGFISSQSSQPASTLFFVCVCFSLVVSIKTKLTTFSADP